MTTQHTFRFMTMLAHPDDESFGAAGSLYRAVQAGHTVAVVSATRGEEGEIAAPELATPETLGQVREQELRAACAEVGVTDVSFLDYRDGHLAAADEHEALGRVVYQIRRFRPDVLLTFAANGMYGHPDHMAIHRLTVAAVPLAADAASFPDLGLPTHRVHKVYYVAAPREQLLGMREVMRARGEDFLPGGNAATIPLEEMGEPETTITTTIVLNDDEFSAKIRSMRRHATQMPATHPFMSASPEELRAFAGIERFVLAPQPLASQGFSTPEADLFAGL